MVRSGHVLHTIMIGGSTYVGMITVSRAEQNWKAWSDMVTREVGRDRLVRAEQAAKAQSDMVTREVGRDRLVRLKLSRRDSYKKRRRRRRRRRKEVDNLVDYRYIIT